MSEEYDDIEFPMSDPGDSIDFEKDFTFDDSGNLIFTPSGGSEEKKPLELGDPVKEKTEQPEEVTQESKPETESAKDDRIAVLEEQINKLTALFGGYVAGQQGREDQAKQHSEPEDTDEDIYDAQKLKRYIAQAIEDGVQQRLKPYEQAMQHSELSAQYNVAASKLGKEFQERLPEVVELMKVDTRLDFEQAFNAIKAIDVVRSKPVPAKNENGNIQAVEPRAEVKPVTPEEVMTRAKNLALPSQNSMTPQSELNSRRVHTVDDALDKAFQEIFGK